MSEAERKVNLFKKSRNLEQIEIKMFYYDGSRFNWEHPINGDTNISAYSSSILLIMFSYDGWNTLNLVPQESISNNNNIDEAIAATFFYRLFGKSVVVRTALIVLSVIGTAAAGVWSLFGVHLLYCLLEVVLLLQVLRYFQLFQCIVIGFFISLLLIRRNKKNELKKKQFDMNDKELNENSSLFSNITQEYKVPLPFAIIFILAGLFILVFSFVVNVECPKDKPNCDLREKTAQQLAPILISYGLLFVALTCSESLLVDCCCDITLDSTGNYFYWRWVDFF
ncbi:hypothetical protein RhiirA4_467477 [Rhizophagus irregularis]|uniref:Uncharacterized protein n=1 Tax=Rhizophagus irregularis TaxID=588596 RepID=A0A2I1GW11_9GLOM|nr:hypothetical protein RhiirA4_467477 [Rhizophagus irregularis]